MSRPPNRKVGVVVVNEEVPDNENVVHEPGPVSPDNTVDTFFADNIHFKPQAVNGQSSMATTTFTI